MSALEFTKILGAFLGAGIVASLSGFITGLVYPEPELEPHAYVVTASAEVGEEAATAAAETEDRGIGPLLAAADPEAGRKVINKCAACHSLDKGGPHKIGPNLWDIVNRPVAAAEGYAYSSALRGKSDEAWSYQNLDAYLRKPKDWAPGTKMSFAGIKKPGQRADLIAFLRSLSDSPATLPE